jgi:hypothetical protein
VSTWIQVFARLWKFKFYKREFLWANLVKQLGVEEELLG